MANREFFFFFTPTWDFPPDGPIKLGNIITSVKTPHRPLSCLSPPEDVNVFKTEKHTVHYTKEKLRGGKFSIFTKFLSVFRFSFDIAAQVDKSDEEIFAFKTLETVQFVPTASYLQACIEADNVRRFLQISRYRKPVYIITGLKTVTGAAASTLKSRTMGGTLAGQIDGTVWSGNAVPIIGGPGMSGDASKKVGTEWQGSSDFVFAFRVSRLAVCKETQRVDSEEEYRKGAMLGNGAEDAGNPKLSVVEEKFVDAEAEGFYVERLKEDENVVFCAIPEEESPTAHMRQQEEQN